MEKYVVSRELAEKLRAAGYPQHTTLYWCSDLNEVTYSKNCSPFEKAECGSHAAAPLSDELLEQLKGFDWDITNQNSEQLCLVCEGVGIDDEGIFGKRLCDVLAELWLYLKEHGYLDGKGK